MSEHEAQPSRGTPGVGNILGFSLLFRDRRALLALPRRSLAPGIKLRDYEAEIPGVQFPLKGPLSATAFRGHRCRAERLTLSLEARGLRRYLEARLIGRRIAGLRISQVTLDLRAALPDLPSHRPVLRVVGRRRDGALSCLVVAFHLEPAGRRLRLIPSHRWVFGLHPPGQDAASMWVAVARRLVAQRAELDTDDGAITVDPAYRTMTPAFVGAGWKTPDLDALVVESLALSRRAVTLELRAGEDAGGVNVQAAPPPRDPVAEALERIRRRLDAGELHDALEHLAQLSDLFHEQPQLRLVLVRWRVELARWRAPESAREALHEWLDLRPSDHEARRMLAVQLARQRDAPALAKLLAADCRSPHPPVTQARLELALATLLVTELGEARSALSLIGPLVSRLRSDDAMPPELLPNALVCLAQARAADTGSAHKASHAPHAIEALDEALDLVEEGPRRSDMRARLARTFAERGSHAQALRLLMAALQEDPQSLELIDDAIGVAEAVGEYGGAADLLRKRIELSPVEERELQHERLADVLVRLDTPASRREALTLLQGVLEFAPDDTCLLRKTAHLERDEGDPRAAAEQLRRVLDDPELTAQERRDLELERARLLRRVGDLDDAWAALRPMLAEEAPPSEGRTSASLELLELALELAPPTDREALLDRLVAEATGPARGRALLERAAQSFDPDQRLQDLWEATSELRGQAELPETLLAIEALVQDDEGEALEELAHVASECEVADLAQRSWVRLARHHARQLPEPEAGRAAVEAFERAQRLEPLPLGLQQVYARALVAAERREDALTNYRVLIETLEARPDDDPALRRVASVETLAFEAAELAVAAGRPDRVESLLWPRAEDFSREGRARAVELRYAALEALGDDEGAATLVNTELGRHRARSPERASWLLRRAAREPEAEQLDTLREARTCAPEDPKIDARFVELLAAHGRPGERLEDLRARLSSALEDERGGDHAPSLDGGGALALLQSLITLDEAHPQIEGVEGVEDVERLRWHELRLERDPEAVDSLLEAARIHLLLGHAGPGLEHYRRAALRLESDDPRRLEPARALAKAAAEEGDWELARAHASSALELAPQDLTMAEVLIACGRALEDAALLLHGLEALRDTSGEEPPQLALERARALESVGREGEAFEVFAQAASRVAQGSALHLEIAEAWLAAAEAGSGPEQQLNARTQLRLALGPDLPIEALVEELTLAATLGHAAAERARPILATALVQRRADPALLPAVQALVEAHPEESLSTFTAALASLPEVVDASALAARLAGLAREAEDPRAALRALDKLPEGGRRHAPWAELRDWAALGAGQVEVELAELRTQLAREPHDALALLRLRRLCSAEEAGALLLDLAARLPDAPATQVAIRVAGDEFGRDLPPELRLQALERLAQRAASDPLELLWPALAGLFDPRDPERLSRFIEVGLSAGPAALQEAARAKLDAALRERPDSPRLFNLLWEDLEGPAARAHGSAAARSASEDDARLQALALRVAAILRRLDPEPAATLVETVLTALEADRHASVLEHLVRELHDQSDARALSLAALAERGAWSALCRVLEFDLDGPPAADAARWADLAEHARRDGHEHAELEALGRAVEAYELADDALRCVELSARILELAPERADLRWRQARRLERLGQRGDAAAAYLYLLEQETWSDAGVELGVLARHAGLACAGNDDARAAELLELARRRGDGDRESSATLFEVDLRLERPAAARALALELADSSSDPAERDAWLVRAQSLASGAQALDILERRIAIAPDATGLRREAEARARELGDFDAAHRHAHRRLELEPSASESILRQLIADLEAERRTGDEGELPKLRRQLLELRPDDLPLLLAHADSLRGADEAPERQTTLRRALAVAAPEEPSVIDAALELAAIALDERPPDLEAASPLVQRLRDARPEDPRVQGLLVRHARASGDDATLVAALETLRGQTRDPLTRAKLAEDTAEAASRLGQLDRAQAAFLSAHEELARAGEAPPSDDPGTSEAAQAAEASGAAADLFERWITWARELDAPHAHRFELEALRSQLARAKPAPLAAGRAREYELCDALGLHLEACALCEAALSAAPENSQWSERFVAQLDRLDRGAKRESLLRLTQSLAPGHARDGWAQRLLSEARADDAPRSALTAFDALGPELAARSDALSVREWAIRELGQVDQEIQALEARLIADPGDADAANRILRMVDGDARAAAVRIGALADVASDEHAQAGLRRRALDLLVGTGARGLHLAVEQLAHAAREGLAARKAWESTQAVARELEDRDALVRLARTASLGAAGPHGGANLWRARRLPALEAALPLAPKDRELHGLLASTLAEGATDRATEPEGEAGLPPIELERLEWLERLADTRGLDAELLADLVVTGADLTSEPVRWLEHAGRRQIERARFVDRVERALGERGAWTACLGMLEARDELDPSRWEALASQPQVSAQVAAQAWSRAAALYRDAGRPSDAATLLARAIEATPDRNELHARRADALIEAGATREALDALQRLLREGRARQPMQTARRAARLAHELEDRGAERRLLELALTNAAAAERPHAHVEIAEALYALLDALDDAAAAASLASGMAELPLPHSQRLTWHERAASGAEGELRAKHLRGALTLLERAGSAQAPATGPDEVQPEDAQGDREQALADALVETLSQQGSEDEVLELLLHRAELAQRRQRDEAEVWAAWSRLRERLETDPTTTREDAKRRELRAAALRGQLALRPEETEARLALAELRAGEGDDEAASSHYRSLLDRLDPQDPRLDTGHRVLARVARQQGDLDRAIAHLEAARRTSPDDTGLREELVELARTAKRHRLLASLLDEALEDIPDDAQRRLALLQEQLRARLAASEFDGALASARRISTTPDFPTEARRDASQRWIELAQGRTDDGAIEDEARARAALRSLTPDPLPSASWRAELRLLRTLGEHGAVEDLAREALAHHPNEGEFYEHWEWAWMDRPTVELSEGDEPEGRAFIDALLRLLSPKDDASPPSLAGSVRARAAARLLELGRRVEDPQACLNALDALPPEVAKEDAHLEVREWAVRSLGRIEDELSTLEALLLQSPDPALLARMHRLLEDVESTVGRVWALVESEALEGAARVELARVTLRFAARTAPTRLGLLLSGFSALDELGALDAASEFMELVETLATGGADAAALLTLKQVLADTGDHPVWRGRRIPLFAALLRRFPDDLQLHATLHRLEADDPGIFDRVVERLADQIGDRDADMGRVFVTRARVTNDSTEALVADWLRQAKALGQGDAVAVLLDALAEAGAFEALASFWLAQEVASPRRREALQSLTRTAGEQAPHVQAVAWRELALTLAAETETAEREAALSRALEANPRDPVLAHGLGTLLASVGRHEAALEQLLPLAESVDGPQLGLQPQLPDIGPLTLRQLTIDGFDLLLECASLLRRSGQPQRAHTYLERLREMAPERASAWAEPLYELLIELEAREDAEALCEAEAERATASLDTAPDTEATLRWRRRAAALASGDDRVRHLRNALRDQPADAELARQLRAALRELGDRRGLAASIDAWLAQTAEAPERRSAAEVRELAELARERIALADQAKEQGDAAPTLDARVSWWRLVLAHDPDDVEAVLAVAEAFASEGTPESEERAVAAWQRAGQLLARDDDRFYEPAHRLAARHLTRGEVDDARKLLERALEIRPGDAASLSELRRCAEALGDDVLALRVVRALLERSRVPDEAAELELESARILLRQGQYELGFAAFERAATLDGTDHENKVRRLDAWLEATRASRRDLEETARMRFEAVARGQARAHLGDALAQDEFLAEVRLLAQGLGRNAEALDLLEANVERWPDADRLHTAFRELAFASRMGSRYAEALARTSERVDDGELRAELQRRRAFVLLELEDAEGVLETLVHLEARLARDPELLDLRDWALRRAGRLDIELDALDEALLAAPEDPLLLERLLRSLDRDPVAAARRLLELHRRALEGSLPGARASESTPDLALVRAALEQLMRSGEPVPVDLRVDIARAMVTGGDLDGLRAHWEPLAGPVIEAGAPDALAAFVAFARKIVEAGHALSPGPKWMLERGLAARPESPALLGVFWRPFSSEAADFIESGREKAPQDHPEVSTEAVEVALAAMRDLAASLGASGHVLASLWIAFCGPLDRRQRARVLAQRARGELLHEAAFRPLVQALESENHWPEAVSLWEARADAEPEVPARLSALKHLAHLAANVLGDPSSAIDYLERALELAPHDPDLLLPLLDHYYAQPELHQAIALSATVLEHVPMGNVAFAALGNRAADAALAHGDHAGAVAMLDRVLDRCPNDRRSRERRSELDALASDPEHRARMLAAIADRQSGSARHEALEERARLLVDPLDRSDEAISVLERLLAESPTREGSAELLAELYRRHHRWTELVELLERRFSSHTGDERTRMLEEIATIQRHKLFDLPRAEQALNLALENHGDDLRPDASLDGLIVALAEVLDQQGRYANLAEELRTYLAPELAGARPIEGERIRLASLLADTLREHLDEPTEAAQIYAMLEAAGHLPESGLATLARWYRGEGRYEDLIRVLEHRARRLGENGDRRRKAEVDLRIGELLEGPLRRPHDAADHFLDAYLTHPAEYPEAGIKARVLLAGTDSVVNVRQRLLDRAKAIEPEARPALLTLLGDLLAPHEEHESEAEKAYRRAIELEPELAQAHEGLGRLLAREARLEDAAEALVTAATSERMPPDRAADNAATAARVLLELGRADEAEGVLRQALGRAPTAQRALLELARLYERLGRAQDQADVLDELSMLPVSSILRAEIAFRRAMLLEEAFKADPLSEAGESARSYLLEAVSSDNMHAQARQVLLELASARSEWSIVAHMYYLTIRELSPGAYRAQTHLDLAEVYLDRLRDHESATRNVASAIGQAPRETVVVRRASSIASRLPDAKLAADRVSAIANGDQEIDADGRARLWMLCAELQQRAGDFDAAADAMQRAATFRGLHDELRQALRRLEESLQGEDHELRRERSGLLRLLDAEEQAGERMHILGRLRELGRALDDGALVDRADREQLALAKELLREEGARDPSAAREHLRELFAEHRDYARVLDVYDRLIAEAETPALFTGLNVDAARLAWTGQRDARAAYQRLEAALQTTPDSDAVLELLAELLTSAEDPEIRSAIVDHLTDEGILRRAPRLALRLADGAAREEQYERSNRLLRALADATIEPALRLQARTALDANLEAQGLHSERIPNLEAAFELAKTELPDRVGDAAVPLARALRGLGSLDAARDLCADTLMLQPAHLELTRLYVDLLDLSQDWRALARALEQLAALTIEPEDRARWLTRGARVLLNHTGEAEGAQKKARDLLLEACQTSRRSVDARAELVPLAFAERRWDEVLEYAIQLRAIAGDDHECLIYAALAEAYVHGRRTLARAIDRRHDRSERVRTLWPSAAVVLDRIASRGPLPRLDAVIGAAAAMAGGTQAMLDEFSAWAASRNVGAGVHLARARLQEAAGQAVIARHLYQLAAFTAPEGPVVDLIRRLPQPQLPLDPLRQTEWIPLEWRCALREVLIQLRTRIAGVRAPIPIDYKLPESTTERATIQSAGRMTAPWRDALGMAIPIRLTSAPLPMHISVRNEAEPLILLNGDFIHLPEGERAFRLAMAATTIATGLALLDDSYPGVLNDLVDALVALVNPRHVPDSDGARTIVESLAAAGMTGAQLPPALRERLGDELGHWFAKVPQLEHVLRRSRLLMATQLSGRLDGALMAMARDRGLIVEGDVPDGTTILETDDARWLLLSLGLFGSGFDPATGHPL